ncbi:hypothetical protein [Teichococcus aestuarii]|uniref:hypothetical protein n=1 Tax=Teichococcus aestuarii TaxID=568898 RepID=UPI003605C9DA
MPEAGTILTGESLDHLTQGSRILQDEDGPRLCVSASLPPWPGLLEASVDWLGGQLRLALGEVAGFTVPAHSHRHDMRLLIWTGTRLCPLGPLPDQRAGALAGGCSMAAFQRAAGLPAPDEPESVLRPIMRRVALAQLRRQALPVSQALLDGPFEGRCCSASGWPPRPKPRRALPRPRCRWLCMSPERNVTMQGGKSEISCEKYSGALVLAHPHEADMASPDPRNFREAPAEGRRL